MSRVLERSSAELNLAHYRVLSAIASGDQRASRVAARLALGRPTVSSAVDALCKRGLIERTGVEGDQRAASLSLTRDGEAMLERVEAEMVRRLDLLCARTPDGAQVIQSLAWLGPAIDAAVAERRPDSIATGR
ncbi:DNA-binding MarR family transcriptional regulator [Antricoccus suffuscus]|uniref:DNA-binding MarR family transcriptional regulator n=2 Tax=Antricoccus suffuscus TaxID=1629062 RepID=A0A2T1A1N0_9ACTN|nr:DNA-binding MarR family transcriptional regulator [Antricoccus suffuscus]